MSSQSIGKQLTADLILAKTKAPNLENIKNLNLWGNQLEDLSILQKMPNLQVISLSVNKISSLRDFRYCQKLQELYLRKNCIADLKQIKYLMKLPTLKVLWLHDNPCALVQNYRQIVIRHLPNLQKLDNNPVSPEQKKSSESIKIKIVPFSQEDEKLQIKKERPPILQPTKLSNQYKEQKIESKQLERPEKVDKNVQMSRNQNILMAVLSLMRELDVNSLEIVKKESENMTKNFY